MQKKPVAIAVGTVLVGGLALAGSAFAVTDLAGGYMQAATTADAAATETKKAEGTCGAEAKAAEGKCGEGKCGLDKMDADKDGKVSKAEFAAGHDGKDDKFASHDTNGDGFVDAAEFEASHKASGDKAKTEGKCGEGKCGGSA